MLVNATTLSLHGNKSGEIVKEHVRLEFLAVGETPIPVDIELLYQYNAPMSPAVLTQFDHRGWALRGVSRGWIGVLMPTGDAHDATFPFYLAYNSTRPRPTWGLITRRAWLVSLILDYLTTQRSDLIDPHHISMFGHSRNGKQTLIAAAFDTRLTSVVGSSPGFPIATPARFAGK